jgi:Ca2+-transporting ATPase
VQFAEKFNDPVIRILIIAAVISFGVGALEGHVAIESLGIVVAILLATGLAFINEFRANKEFDVLNQTSDEALVKVLRDGAHATIPRRDVVVGDLVELNQGDEIPADGQVLKATAMEVNESAFTGESLPARKSAESLADDRGTYSANQVLRSTMVVDGSGAMRVEKVGDATEIGKTARLAAEETGEQSPLNAQLERLSKWIGVIGFAIAAGTFAALTVRGALKSEIVMDSGQWVATLCAFIGIGIALIPIWLPLIYDFFELTGREKEAPGWLEQGWKTWVGLALAGAAAFGLLIGIAIALKQVPADPSLWVPLAVTKQFLTFFMIAVTIIVVAVPEGLAMSVTLSLAYSMRRMTATNCLVRRMDACETIGAATHICSDKTGTLTMNEMLVQEGYFGHVNKAAAGGLDWHQMQHAPNFVYEAIGANSTANLGNKGQPEPGTAGSAPAQGQIGVIGNPTEGALLLWMKEHGHDYDAFRARFDVTRQWPFSTERKFMATLGQSDVLNTPVLHVKGAPDIVLERCAQMLGKNGPEPLDPHRATLNEVLADCQARGMRTLAFACRIGELPADVDLESASHDLLWLGFVAIADPVRPEVRGAIEKCRAAGIDVKIVTGDNALTAREIARQIGLWDGPNGASTNGAATQINDNHANAVMLGPDFAALSDDEATSAAGRLKVLARARPADKLRLVDLLQKQGSVVAVTGDGTNDAPALNYAQVGLAMGKAGTAVAKEASDIIIMDDSFASIATAVKWGRSLYLNIQKFILFQLTINVAACGIALLGPFIGVKLPLTVMQMLWVNLIMDTFAALALATEPPEEKVMSQNPRKPDDFIVSGEMARKIFTMGIAQILIFIALLTVPSLLGMFSSGGAMLDTTQAGGEELSPQALSIFFSIFVLLQFWNMFNARTLGSTKSAFSGLSENPYFLVIAVAILLGQILIVNFGGTFFRVVPLDMMTWVKILAVTSLVLWIGEIIRFLSRAREKNTGQRTPTTV